jgi:peptidyl-dipeptidase Dcp
MLSGGAIHADDPIDVSSSAAVPVVDNPLLRDWSDQPFHLPPFEEIRPSHFANAFEVAMSSHISDLERIASSSSINADFDTILGAYDRAGSLLSKISCVYGTYTSSVNIPDMQKVQTEMAPVLSRHNSKTYDVPGLFEKIELMYGMRDDRLMRGEWTHEQARFAERVSRLCHKWRCRSSFRSTYSFRPS